LFFLYYAQFKICLNDDLKKTAANAFGPKLSAFVAECKICMRLIKGLNDKMAP
jgi:hypothetical protein